ncbi:MAG TPA: ATP-binding protein, partial [Phycisphaerae bacterium]|nr:ATP-binding protein [Phycisphaerae bacterium]
MFKLKLEEIEEKDLIALERDQIPESIRLEFKRELNIDNRKEKAEAAKDVSAMANTAGGRILYGLDEKDLPDGSTVASSICPLTDGSLDHRLEDVLLSSIHPRPRFRTRKIPVNSNTGFVLVVEVYPAYSGDLHMVTGFNESRFYRRGEQRTILMTEPEIREAYARIAASRQALDGSMEQFITTELERVPKTQESVLVIPWFGHNALVNPMRFGHSFGAELASGPLQGNDRSFLLHSLAVVSEGYRSYRPESGDVRDCNRYLAIRRNGLLHLAIATMKKASEGPAHFYAAESLEMIVTALDISAYVLEKAGYWGPVRIVHRLNVDTAAYIKDP